MKTTLRLTIAALGLAIFNLSTAVVQAEYKYTTNNGTITITGYTGPGGAVNIPDTINGLPVTSIGDGAFVATALNLTSVTIPNSVTSIGRRRFAYCTSLTNISIPSSVTSIGRGAFNSCTSLTSVTIPNSVTTIEAYSFYNCTSLTKVTIGSSVTTIGEWSVLWLHQPDQRDDPQQRYQYRGGGVH